MSAPVFGPGAATADEPERQAGEIALEAFVDTQRLTGLQVGIIAICALVAFCDAYSIQAVNYAGPSLRAAFGLNPAELGTIFSLSLFGMMLGSFAIGPISDRFGRRRPMLILTALFGLLTASVALTTSFSQIAVLRFLDGCALGAALPNAYVLAAEYSPARYRRFIVGLMMVGYTAGGFGAGATAAPLIAAWGWQSIFLVGGGVALLAVVGGCLFVPDSLEFLIANPRKRKQFDRIVARLTPDPTLTIAPPVKAGTRSGLSSVAILFSPQSRATTIALWVLSFSIMLVCYLFLSWTPIVLKDAGLSLSDAIVATMMFNLGTILSAVAAGWLMDRYNPGWILVFLMLIGAAALVMMGPLITHPLGLRAAVLMVGFGIGGAMGGMNLLATTIYPAAARVTGSGMAISVGRLGSVVGPMIGAFWLSSGFRGLDIYIAALAPVALALTTTVVLGRTRQQPSDS